MLCAFKQQEKQAAEGEGTDTGQKERLANMLADFQQCFSLATIQDKRDFIRFFIKELKWDGTDLHIFLYEREGIESMDTSA